MNPGKSIAIIKPSLFPTLDYFQLIHAVDCFYLLDDHVEIEVAFRHHIHQEYHRAPYYAELEPSFDQLFQSETNSDFVERSLLWVCHYLNINTPIYRWSDVQSHQLQNQENIIAFCRQMNAKQFLSLPNSPMLIEESCFQKNKIQLLFLLSQIKQFSQSSIIDLLMNVSRAELQNHLQNYRIALPILQTAFIK